MHELILLVIVVAVGIVLLMQFGVVSSLIKEMRTYRQVLFSSYKFDEQEEHYKKITSSKGEESEILKQLNRYLEANSYTVPNFEILKDIIERHTLAEEDRIRALLPIPLYYGLSGTILGIILGIIPLAMSSSENLLSDFPMLLAGVAIAMAGSFVGVVITSWANKTYKDASLEHELCKNALYSFIQIELFPIMNNSPAGPTAQLVRAMGDFTEDFTASAETMQVASENISETFATQKELLELMKQLSDAGIAKQNLRMAKEMSQYVDIVSNFNNSIMGMQVYVERLSSVTAQLQNSTEYLSTLQKLTGILSSEEAVIQQTVVAQKHNLQDGINGIQRVANESLVKVEEQQRIMLDSFARVMNETLVKFEEYLTKNQTIPTAVDNLLGATLLLPDLLGKLSTRLDGLQKCQEEQTKAIRELSRVQDKAVQKVKDTPKLQQPPTVVEEDPVGRAQEDSPTGPQPGWFRRLLNAIRGRR